MEIDPKTTPLLSYDCNSKVYEDGSYNLLFSTLANTRHNGLPLQEGMVVFTFDYGNYDKAEIAGGTTIVENHCGRLNARFIEGEDSCFCQ